MHDCICDTLVDYVFEYRCNSSSIAFIKSNQPTHKVCVNKLQVLFKYEGFFFRMLTKPSLTRVKINFLIDNMIGLIVYLLSVLLYAGKHISKTRGHYQFVTVSKHHCCISFIMLSTSTSKSYCIAIRLTRCPIQ